MLTIHPSCVENFKIAKVYHLKYAYIYFRIKSIVTKMLQMSFKGNRLFFFFTLNEIVPQKDH